MSSRQFSSSIAGRPPSGRDIELANEIHGTSIEALQVEARAFQAQVSGAVHHPLSTVVPVLVPLIAIIVKNLRKTTKEAAAFVRSTLVIATLRASA